MASNVISLINPFQFYNEYRQPKYKPFANTSLLSSINSLGNKTKDNFSIKNSNFFKEKSASTFNFTSAYPSQKLPSSFTPSQLSNYFGDTLSMTPSTASTYSMKPNRAEEQKPISKAIASSMIGFQNLGNTCFMNTCLQNLIHTEAFIERLFQSKDSINYQTPITKRFFDLCASMSSSSSSFLSAISPKEFKNAFSQRHSTFQGYSQHDTQEFCRVLLEDISLELNKVKVSPKYTELKTDDMSKSKSSQTFDELFRKKENSIIIDTFYGQIINAFTCPCRYVSYSFEKLLDIPLLLPPNASSVSLNDLLDSHFESEMIQWESKCVKCLKRTRQKKEIRFSQLPDILILSFQRINGRIRRKNNIEIAFDEEINLRDFVDDDLINGRVKYELYGIGNHSGTIDFGHYYAQIKIDGNWVEFNDSSVSKCFDIKRSSSSVYVLFYRKR